MLLLVDTEPRRALWRANPEQVRSWDVLLREEGLCTPGLYHDFKRAKKTLNVQLFGVYASAALVKLPAEYRQRIMRSTQDWIALHKIPPTYQRITRYVVGLRREAGIRGPSKPIDALRSENNRLKRELNKADSYIETLQATLRKHQIRIPKET
jgi:hypothetical protein